VITAFGRIGAATAAQRLGVLPDMICMAKGLTNAAVPMGAVAASRTIHDLLVEDGADGIELFHGYTYSGHPLACAAAIATLDIYRDEGLFDRAERLSEYWADAVHGLRGGRNVIDLRNLGLIAGIELAPRDGAPGRRGAELFQACFDAGLLVRATGDTIALSPPLIVEEAQIDAMFATLATLIETIS
jgi:beta-alanine--pyruvate transaminase